MSFPEQLSHCLGLSRYVFRRFGNSTYSNSTRYGAAEKDVSKATFMEGDEWTKDPNRTRGNNPAVASLQGRVDERMVTRLSRKEVGWRIGVGGGCQGADSIFRRRT